MAHKIHSSRFQGWVNPAYHTNLTVTLWILLLQWNISESYLETIWMWGDWNGGLLTDLGTVTCGDNMKSVAMLSKWWVVQSQMAFKMAMLERTFKDSVKNNRWLHCCQPNDLLFSLYQEQHGMCPSETVMKRWWGRGPKTGNCLAS